MGPALATRAAAATDEIGQRRQHALASQLAGVSLGVS